ncbi:hypothetical protein KP509_1Z249800 [Ceratopteris richardii]|nr:hypothetical protein KP509_1Z249800 [Ceratopteris richardii]
MGDNITQIVEPNGDEQKEYKTWIEKSRKVLHWILICTSEILTPHIMKASTPKEAWDIIHKIYGTSTEARKIHLQQKLDCIWHGNKLQRPQYKSLDTSILVRGSILDFDELVALCITEEVKICLNASGSGNSSDHALFQHRGRGSRCGHSSSRNANTLDMPRGRGRSNLRGRGRSQAPGNCYHCDKYGHFEKDCYYKQNSQRGRGRSHHEAHGNFSAKSSYRDYGRDNMFSMEHVLNNSGCTNHMKSIGNGFEPKESLKTKEYVATGDDTLHVINDVRNVPLVQINGIQNTLSDVLHVPSITKNLVLVGQLADQDMEVIFNKHGYFKHDF